MIDDIVIEEEDWLSPPGSKKGVKFNPNHDELGRFSEGPGGGAPEPGPGHVYPTDLASLRSGALPNPTMLEHWRNDGPAPEQAHDDARVWFQGEARKAGWGGEKIEVRPGNGPKMTIGGREVQVAGYYHPKEDSIEIFLDHNSGNGLAAVIAHEATHGAFHVTMEKLDIENEDLNKIMNNPSESRPADMDPKSREGRNWPLLSVETDQLNPRLKDDFPVAYAYRELMASKYKEHGKMVSEYAEAWWREWESGKATIESPLNETTAEIGKVLRLGGWLGEGTGRGVSRQWKKWYDVVVATSKQLNAMTGVTDKAAHAVPHPLVTVAAFSSEGWGEAHTSDGSIVFLTPVGGLKGAKFNPNHDELGRFSEGPGGGAEDPAYPHSPEEYPKPEPETSPHPGPDPRASAETDYVRVEATSGAGGLARVDGREIIWHNDIPGNVSNYGSIEASLGHNWEELDGVRVVSMASFEDQGKPSFYNVAERDKVEALAQEIKASGKIEPLIVVVDEKGPYVLEGGHRFDALKILNAKEFPAIVVVDQSAPTSFGPAPAEVAGLPVAQAAALRNIEASLRPRATERMVAYDEHGLSVIDKSGTHNTVGFTKDEIEEMKAVSGIAYTHNHPRGSSFSGDDLALGSAIKATEVRAVGNDRGRDVTYRVSPPKGGEWHDQETIRIVWSEEDKKQYGIMRPQVDAGTLKAQDANQEHGHEVMKRVAQRLGLRYERIYNA